MTQSVERDLLSSKLLPQLGATPLANLWNTVDETLFGIDSIEEADHKTGLVLGYVQSGKTTAMMALTAAAADQGYSIIVAFLGSTNLLLQQNTERIIQQLGISERNDYRWVAVSNPKGLAAAADISGWLKKDLKRVIFIPVLKHAGRISDLAETLANVPDIDFEKVLIIDDEADQASLNTLVRSGEESRTYSAIDTLRSHLKNHAFIQFTATPYAPLLLESSDPLFPRFVKFLEPGTGYTGGREFFINKSERVVRYIPAADETTKALPLEVPSSLESALWNFIIGSAILSATIKDSTPVSMLIHPSPRKDAQERFLFLITRKLASISRSLEKGTNIGDLPLVAKEELERLMESGAARLQEDELFARILFVLGEVKLWLLNSATAVKKIDWNISPFHILVGGNKLDRGFTVEGLTVTYMNRPSSDQVDTIEQRARAFGYRSEFLPYCQFFASAKTIKMLRDIVLTEYDLRARLIDAVDSGMTIAEWASEIGLLLPEGSKPTRDIVVKELSDSGAGWHQIRIPSFDPAVVQSNWELTDKFGMFTAELHDYGRLSFRTKICKSEDSIEFLKKWEFGSLDSWSFNELVKHIERQTQFQSHIQIVLMEQEAGEQTAKPRIRRWKDDVGYVNLFQGRDTSSDENKQFYPGDSNLDVIKNHPSDIFIQIHRTIRRDYSDSDRCLTLALYLGDRKLARKKRND